MKSLKSITPRSRKRLSIPDSRGGLLVRRGKPVPASRVHKDRRRQARVNSKASLDQE